MEEGNPKGDMSMLRHTFYATTARVILLYVHPNRGEGRCSLAIVLHMTPARLRRKKNRGKETRSPEKGSYRKEEEMETQVDRPFPPPSSLTKILPISGPIRTPQGLARRSEGSRWRSLPKKRGEEEKKKRERRAVACTASGERASGLSFCPSGWDSFRRCWTKQEGGGRKRRRIDCRCVFTMSMLTRKLLAVRATIAEEARLVVIVESKERRSIISVFSGRKEDEEEIELLPASSRVPW